MMQTIQKTDKNTSCFLNKEKKFWKLPQDDISMYSWPFFRIKTIVKD